MIGFQTTSRYFGHFFFANDEISSLGKIRIVKKNLVHVHGFPSSLANTEKLRQIKYFGNMAKL